MKKYEAPELNVENYAPDTMIASGDAPDYSGVKNGTFNQNCFGRKCPQGAMNSNGDMCNGIGDDGQSC